MQNSILYSGWKNIVCFGKGIWKGLRLNWMGKLFAYFICMCIFLFSYRSQLLPNRQIHIYFCDFLLSGEKKELDISLGIFRSIKMFQEDKTMRCIIANPSENQHRCLWCNLSQEISNWIIRIPTGLKLLIMAKICL